MELPIEAVLVFGGLFVAGILKGATGIGYSSCALPFLVLAIGLKPAIGLLAIPAFTTNVMVSVSAGHFRATVGRFWPLYLALLPGIALGLALLQGIDPAMPTRLLGGLIILYGAMSLAWPGWRIRTGRRRLQIPIGLANGILTGLTGSQILPLMPYVLALKLKPAETIQAINLAVLLASAALGAMLIGMDMVSEDLLICSVLGIAPALLGVLIGNVVRKAMRRDQFRDLVLFVMVTIGSLLLFRQN